MDIKHILLVEDDNNIALLMKEHLVNLCPAYRVETVSSGEDALNHFENGPWDLVVTDNRMPGMTGLELIRTLKERAPATLTILMTGHGSDEVRQAARRLNVYHYMTKPFPLSDLGHVIKDALALQNGNGSHAPMPEKTPRAPTKVTLAGDGMVGKSSLILRLCTDRFESKRTMTIGVEFHIYDVKHSHSKTRLIVWDVGGQDHFAFTRRAFYRGSKAIGLVYAVSDRRSFERLDKWKQEVAELLPNVPLVLAGNKSDTERQVSWEEGKILADQWGVPFLETSCVTGEGVDTFFRMVADAADEFVKTK
jgi:small GTP-binding protein